MPKIISGSPTQEEVAAIAAALSLLFQEQEESPAPASSWRFSGRWWHPSKGSSFKKGTYGGYASKNV